MSESRAGTPVPALDVATRGRAFGLALSCYAQAVVVTVVTVAALAALVIAMPRVAARVVQEGAAVEWMQVALFAGAGAGALSMARRGPAAPGLILALMFGAFIAREVELERLLFGRPVIAKNFLMDVTVARRFRLLTALVLVALAGSLLLYAWRRRADLLPEARALLREPWGRLLLCAVGLLIAVQALERPLGWVLPLPKYFLEESLELLGALYCALAVGWRASRSYPAERTIA